MIDLNHIEKQSHTQVNRKFDDDKNERRGRPKAKVKRASKHILLCDKAQHRLETLRLQIKAQQLVKANRVDSLIIEAALIMVEDDTICLREALATAQRGE